DGALREGFSDTMPLVGFGEPFLYPHLLEAVQYIKQRSPATKVTLTSNGTLLNAQWGRDLAQAGLDQITISVTATSREQYRRINASNDYDKVVSNTKEFLSAVDASGRKMVILLQVLSGVNDDTQIAKFKAEWAPYLGRCGSIQIQPFINWAGQIDTDDIL